MYPHHHMTHMYPPPHMTHTGTRALSDEEEDRTGLASQHAYAVLDVAQACGRRLVKVKNPWCHMRWKGDFSPSDENNWTPELRAAVKYDQHAAQEVDNLLGLFCLGTGSLLTLTRTGRLTTAFSGSRGRLYKIFTIRYIAAGVPQDLASAATCTGTGRERESVCVCACVCASERACVRACVRLYVCVCVLACAATCTGTG
jgi:hypothetical protein